MIFHIIIFSDITTALSGRPGGYPDDDLIKIKIKLKKDRVCKATKEMLRAAPVLTHFD